jgi:hypothetical protein
LLTCHRTALFSSSPLYCPCSRRSPRPRSASRLLMFLHVPFGSLETTQSWVLQACLRQLLLEKDIEYRLSNAQQRFCPLTTRLGDASVTYKRNMSLSARASIYRSRLITIGYIQKLAKRWSHLRMSRMLFQVLPMAVSVGLKIKSIVPNSLTTVTRQCT